MYGPTWSLVFRFCDSELPELERDVGSSAEDDDGTGRLRHQVREHPEVGHLDVQVRGHFFKHKGRLSPARI